MVTRALVKVSFAAQVAASEVAKAGLDMGIQKVGVMLKVRRRRESAIRAINAAG